MSISRETSEIAQETVDEVEQMGEMSRMIGVLTERRQNIDQSIVVSVPGGVIMCIATDEVGIQSLTLLYSQSGMRKVKSICHWRFLLS